MELLHKNSTTVQPPSKSFNTFPFDFENDTPINITLDKLNSLKVYTHISK